MPAIPPLNERMELDGAQKGFEHQNPTCPAVALRAMAGQVDFRISNFGFQYFFAQSHR